MVQGLFSHVNVASVEVRTKALCEFGRRDVA